MKQRNSLQNADDVTHMGWQERGLGTGPPSLSLTALSTGGPVSFSRDSPRDDGSPSTRLHGGWRRRTFCS